MDGKNGTARLNSYMNGTSEHESLTSYTNSYGTSDHESLTSYSSGDWIQEAGEYLEEAGKSVRISSRVTGE